MKETTLKAVSGWLGKLTYRASLRRAGKIRTLGNGIVHGLESSERALRAGAYGNCERSTANAVSDSLVEDLQESSKESGVPTYEYVERMRERFRFAAGGPAGHAGGQLNLIRCCWRFRSWRRIERAPLGQFHSDSHDLTENLCFLRVAQDANRDRRKWMRLQNNLFASHAAPAAGIPSRVSTK